MAIISTKGAYGLTAIMILAREDDNTLLQIKEIAHKGDIPKNYLEQILVQLKKSGLVQSVRGANGGYKLSRDASSITVYEVVNSLECCLTQIENKNKNNILQPFWDDTREKIKEIFSLTLTELEEFLKKDSENFTYTI